MINVTYEDHMGSDLSVVKAARVSFNRDGEDVSIEDQERLIKYLVRGMQSSEYDDLVSDIMASDDLTEVKSLLWKWRKTPTHASPFGHSFLSFTVDAPIYVARQLVKHEYLRMSEISRRYVKGKPEYYIPDQLHGIADNVKQGCGEVLDIDQYLKSTLEICAAVDDADESYQFLLKKLAPEEARMVLPLCHMTRWRWSGSLDAFMNMCNLRLDSHTQNDTRKVAEMIGGHINELFPLSWASYVEGDI